MVRYNKEDLQSGDRGEIHGARLKLFAKSLYDVTQELYDQLTHQKLEFAVVEAFVDMKRDCGSIYDIYLRTRWKGF